MSSNSMVKFLVAILIFGMAATSRVAAAENAPVLETAAFDLTGKIMVLLVDRSNALEQKNDSEVIENARIQIIGGRFFVVGTAYRNPKDKSEWRKGAEVGVAWEEVTSFYLYSKENFENYVNAAYDE